MWAGDNGAGVCSSMINLAMRTTGRGSLREGHIMAACHMAPSGSQVAVTDSCQGVAFRGYPQVLMISVVLPVPPLLGCEPGKLADLCQCLPDVVPLHLKPARSPGILEVLWPLTEVQALRVGPALERADLDLNFGYVVLARVSTILGIDFLI